MQLMKILLAQVILLADYNNVSWGDRIKYIWNATSTNKNVKVCKRIVQFSGVVKL